MYDSHSSSKVKASQGRRTLTTLILALGINAKQDDLPGEEGAMINNNFNIDLDSNAADINAAETNDKADEYNKVKDNKDQIPIIHDNYKPNIPYRPPKV